MADTYDLSTDTGVVRLLLSDTDTTDTTWSDAEIAAILGVDEIADNVWDAAAALLETARASFKKLVSVRLFGEVSVSADEKSRELGRLAESYRQIARMGAQAQMTQLQLKIDEYGVDRTDHTETSAATESDFEDYSEDRYQAL